MNTEFLSEIRRRAAVPSGFLGWFRCHFFGILQSAHSLRHTGLLRIKAPTQQWKTAKGFIFYAICLLPGSLARGDVTVCVTDESGEPLRRVWVQHWLREYMTNVDGCVTIDTDDNPIDIRVFAHNPVVRMDDGGNLAIAVSQEIRVFNDRTVAISSQGNFWRIAERFRQAYNNGLREFSPWNNSAFPGANVREPPAVGVLVNVGILRAVWPDRSPAIRAWTEGAAAYSSGLTVMVGFPLIHLRAGEETQLSTIRHELGHALHFSKVTNATRIAMETAFGAFLATDETRSHCFDRRTNPTVAWIEAFGFFADEFANTPAGPDKHAEYFRKVGTGWFREELMDGETAECAGSNPETGPMNGPSVEGAVFLALFYDYARRANIGLDFVVRTYIESDCMDVTCYGNYIKDNFGENSARYRDLVEATGCFGIVLGDGPRMQGAVEPGDQFGGAVVSGDWNGDGFIDVAIGSPQEDIGSKVDSGMVSILYGSPDSLSVGCNCAITEDTDGVPGSCEPGDRFGAALAAGDFDGDGFDDLAIGAPSESIGDIGGAGYVVVIYGSPTGLQPAFRASEWWPDKSGMLGQSQRAAGFGSALAAGDFNGDEEDDLAIGAPNEDLFLRIGQQTDVGSVSILYGSESSGLTTQGNQRIPAPQNVNDFAHFGSALAAGDLDGDGRADLAIGAPNRRINNLANAGTVFLYFGGAALSAAASRSWSRESEGVAGDTVAHAAFGKSLAFGDFNADGLADLAIGAPGDDVGATNLAGSVSVFYGATSGRDAVLRSQLWRYSDANDGQAAVEADFFGTSLATGDFDVNGFDDLVIGTPNREIGSIRDAGEVTALYGRAGGVVGFPLRFIVPAGLATSNSQRWSQERSSDSACEPDEFYGSSATTGDFNQDGFPDILIGVPHDKVDGAASAGSVHENRGGLAGLQERDNRRWDQDYR